MEMEIGDDHSGIPETIQAQFVSDTGEDAGPPLELPASVNVTQLGRICNAILEKVCTYNLFNQKYINNCNLNDYFLGRSINLHFLHKRERSYTFIRKVN